MAKSYAHHPELGSEIFEEEELPELYANGWYDTPAKFPFVEPGADLEAETPAKRGRRRK